MDYIKNRIQRHNRKGIMVGITTRCSAYNIQWLKDFLTEKFQDLILDVEHLLITNTNRYEWENNVNKYSVVILYHTQHQGRANITDVDGGIYDEELKYLCNKLGKEKILVVLDDMEDISKDQRQRILESQPSLTRLSSHLILLPKFGKDGAASRKREEFLTVFGSEQTTSCADRNIPDQTTSWTGPDDNNILGNGYWPLFSTQSPYKKNRQPSLAKYTVGIFSRSGDDNYQWLVGSLQKVNIGRSIDVCKVYISNNYHSYYSEMSRCNFAILYHTQKQGRLNITDVTDSLYDQELKELSEFLGKENVIVVVDDLMDASNEARQRILENQPSIGSLAGGLFLFSEQHKDSETVQEIMTIIRNDGGRENVIRVGIKEKLQIWKNKQNKDPQMTLIENDEQTTSSDDENIMDHTSSRTCMYPDDICDHRSFITTRNRNPRSSLAKYTVGIFSRSGDDNYQWLVGSLQAANVGRSIDVCNVYISNNYQSYYSKLSRCNFAILYHTKNQGRLNITDVTDAIYNQELRELSSYLGKENVIVVVDDLMDPSNEEKQRILENQPSIGSLANDLFLFSEQHKDPETLREITTLIEKNGRENVIRVGIKEKLQIWENKQNKDPQMTLIENDEQTTSSDDENIMDHTSSRTCMYPGDICDHRSFITTRNRNPRSSLAKYTVGIFSRSGDDNYQWLVGSLQAANIGRSIDVCNVYISNNFRTYYSKLSRCNFAILYHTKNQGRLNITDITDAIYNQELRELSGYLGKENVIVVVDDLMDPSNEEKQRILGNQPSIGSLANDLFLFSEQHKDPETLREITTLIAKNGKENFIVASENLIDASNKEKQQTMKDLILFTEEYKDQETPQPMMTLEKGIGVDESRTMKLSPVSALQYIGAQEVEQRQGPPQNTYDESILTDNDDDDDGSALHHLRGATRRKPRGARYNTDSLFSDIYTSRKRPNYNPCAYDHEPSSSLKKKNSFEEQEAINISDDTTDKDSWMDNRLRVLNDTGSAFFAQLSELNDSWRRFRRAAQNPQSEIQQLLSKTHTQAEELKEKDIVILNLRKEVYRLQSEEKQKTIEGKDKFIEELKDNRDRLVDKTQEGRKEHPSGTLEEIIQKKEKAIMKLRAEIQNLREKPQDQETSEALQGPLRKRRGAKKWTSEDTKHEQDGGLDAHNTSEPETLESHSTIEDLWQRIAELESRLKHLEYTTDNQRQELDKYRQTVKEQSSKLKEYEELVDSLLRKTEDIRSI
ncbi:uncharacterized protein LOC144000365 isoform X2 [Lithobates pipiens]